MKKLANSLKFFCAGFSCLILAAFFVFYGYALLPFKSLTLEIIYITIIAAGGGLFIGQGIWLWNKNDEYEM